MRARETNHVKNIGANRNEILPVPNRCKLKRMIKIINDITVTKSANVIKVQILGEFCTPEMDHIIEKM